MCEVNELGEMEIAETEWQCGPVANDCGTSCFIILEYPSPSIQALASKLSST